MKIAMFVANFPLLSETFILNQIAGLLDRGHEIEIYAKNAGNMEKIHDIIYKHRMMERVHFFGGRQTPVKTMGRIYRTLLCRNGNFLRPDAWRITCRILRDRRKGHTASKLSKMDIALSNLGKPPYDVIHCQFGHFGPLALDLKRIAAINSKLIISFRGHDATQYEKINSGIYDEIFENADLFLPVSRDIRQRLVDLGCSANKIQVLHSGIDCTKFVSRKRRREENEPTHIISIARLVEMKGLEYAIEAVARAIKMQRHVHYSIVGDGILRGELEKLIERLGVGDQVKLLGWRNHDEAMQLLYKAHILVAPSVTAERGETEGIPNAAKEAMATGIPVLSTLHGGIPELVQDGVSGFLVPERDVEALTERLVYLIDHPEVWPEMGRAGRLHIEAEFDIDKLNDRLVQLYSE